MGYFPGRCRGGSRTAPTGFANPAKTIFKKFIAFLVAFFHLATSAGAATLKFEYDQAGNMISGQGRYYEYNDANQLVKVRKDAPSGPVIAEYVYDYQGQRVKKIENGITTYYIGKHYEERKGNTVNEKTNYIFVNGQRVAASIKKDNEPAKISYYLNNHLGSADVIVDEKGSVTDKVRYYPYGEYRTQPNAQRHTYTGKERDEVTQEYYYEARYYNPAIRRFTQADTITPDIYDPQTLNRYAYARNNPVIYIDPDGHIVWFAALAIGWAAFEIGSTVYDAVMTANDLRDDNLSDSEKAKSVAWFVAGLEAPGSGRLWKKIGGKGFKFVGKHVDNLLKNNKFLKKSTNYIKEYAGNLKKSVTERPTNFRKKTVQDAWENAQEGTTLGSKSCPTCGADVKIAPGTGPRDWDVDHQPKWKDRDLNGMNRKEVLDEYNKDVQLRCIHCNRSDN